MAIRHSRGQRRERRLQSRVKRWQPHYYELMRTLFDNPRRMFLGVFLLCAGLIAFGLYLQHGMGLEPCPMCILQRYAFVVAGVLGLVAALHRPGILGQRLYALAMMAAALAGAGVAARQSWLQHNPPKIVECGPDLGFMFGSFSLGDALPMLFKGTGDCAKVLWRFLGLSIPEWALVFFALIVAAGLVLLRRPGAPVRSPG